MFVKGMRLHKLMWPGVMTVVLWNQERVVPFAAQCMAGARGCDLSVLEGGTAMPRALTDGHDSLLLWPTW